MTAAHVRIARIKIVTLAWQMLRAGRITGVQYQTRIKRANDKTEAAPYPSMREVTQ